MRWRVQIESTGFGHMKPAVIREAHKAAMLAAGTYWHQHFRKLHFTSAAWTRYDYTPRSKKYWAMKMRRGIGLPLVLSGQSRELSKVAVIKTRTRGGVIEAHVAMRARALNFIPKTKGKKPPNMAHELRQINSQENQILEGVMARELSRRLRNHRDKVRVVIGG